jgi:polyhydroxyalkanoate synthesis regulator phasin
MSKFKNNQLLKQSLRSIPTKERIVETVNMPKPDTTNRCGAPAYSLPDELRLLAMLNTIKLEGDQFYRKESETMKELRDLVEKIAMKDPYYVAQMIVWSRCKGEGMRSICHLAASLLAPFISGQEWGRRFYSVWNKKEQKGGCIFRLDDMSEILHIFSSLNQTKLTNAMKKGFANVLESVDSYQLLKYKKTALDIMNLCHPNSKLSRATVEVGGYDVKTLDAIKKDLSVSAKTWEAVQSEAGQIVAQAVREGKLTREEAEKTLEQAKSNNWNELLVEGKLGILAALRNIRNILKVTNTRENIDLLCELLSNGDLILKGKIMPYQIDIAYQVLEDEFTGWQYKGMVETALLKGYEASVPNLKEALPGKTCVMVDCSGSMWARCYNSGTRKQISKTACEKAGLIAATIAKSCDCDIVRFGDIANFFTPNLKHDVFSLGREIANDSYGGTCIGAAFDLIRKNKRAYDRIILLSDNECNRTCDWRGRSWVQDDYKNYMREVCSPYVYCVDFCAYGTIPVANPGKVNYYFGYGYSMFNDIASKEFKPEAHLEEVKKIVI